MIIAPKIYNVYIVSMTIKEQLIQKIKNVQLAFVLSFYIGLAFAGLIALILRNFIIFPVLLSIIVFMIIILFMKARMRIVCPECKTNLCILADSKRAYPKMEIKYCPTCSYDLETDVKESNYFE